VRDRIVPRILEVRDPADPIRIWSTGCATGEEAYTLAMLFAEQMGEEAFKLCVKIYATDVDDSALSVGRHATYTRKQLEPIPAELLERYFEQPVNGDDFSFRADLRRSVIFGRHDLVQDPPISRIDLLVSRNTLMYFDSETQSRILSNFHFALRDDGLLFLGKSEVLVARSPVFVPVDLKRRVFAKVPAATARDRVSVPRILGPLDAEDFEAASLLRDAGFEAASIAQIVIDRAGRLALANMQARMLFGLGQRDIGSLLQDLELSYRPVELRSRIEQVYSERHAITLRDVEWRQGAEVRVVDVHVQPLTSTTGEGVGTAVSITDVTRYRRLQEALQESKREVETAYEELQSTNEELETTNEELQSTNEELETTNEELQSTNEELETMNEELQSTNEELETINDELQQRTDELNEVNAFLEAVLGSLRAGVAVVDRELRIQAWNASARELWGLRSDEVQGEHFLNLDIGLPVDQLRKPIRDALSSETQRELVLDGVDRRGRPVRCRVNVGPLGRDGVKPRGAIVMMEPDRDGAGVTAPNHERR
jgi:two-component system, chemotaxis family, CheB/CheR fusion protein